METRADSSGRSPQPARTEGPSPLSARASRPFQIFVKPAGAVCNLACHYCYYLEKNDLYPHGGPQRMTDAVLEAYIVQHLDAFPGSPVNFSWHGGEPTTLGLDYFRRIVELQREHRRPGVRITNGMQTNGFLLDEAWCEFLAAEGFNVGLSIDGPEDLHDRYRVTRGQQPTHRQAMRAFRLLQRRKVPCDVLCVVHDGNVRHALEVYRFFREIGAQFLTLLPMVERDDSGPGGVSPLTVSPERFGEFLCAIFDEWVRRDLGRISVQIFEEAARPARGLEHSLCIFRETCGDIPVIEHNGDFYSCDHYVRPSHKVGNIGEMPLGDLLESPAQIGFGRAKLDTLPRYCRICEVRAMCNGGCPKDRFTTTPDGEAGLNYLCAAFRRFFTHALPYTIRMAALEREGLPPEHLMQQVTSADRVGSIEAGRNEACPCGSGKKFKKCCGR